MTNWGLSSNINWFTFGGEEKKNGIACPAHRALARIDIHLLREYLINWNENLQNIMSDQGIYFLA